MAELLWILFWRTTGIFWDSLDVDEHCIPSTAKMIHGLLFIINFHIPQYLLTSFVTFYWLHCNFQKLKKKITDFQRKSCYTNILPQICIDLISTEYGVHIIQNISHYNIAEWGRNPECINHRKKPEVLLVVADDLYPAMRWNRIIMSFGLICDI